MELVVERIQLLWYNYIMRKRFMNHCLYLAAFMFCSICLPIGAQGFWGKISWFGEASVLFFPESNGMDSDPMPILPSPGFGAAFPVGGPMKIEVTFDFYLTHYGYSYELERAIPNAIENRSARVIGSILAVQAAAYFNITSLLTVRAYAGPAADLRIVVMAADLGPDDKEDASRQTNSVRKYFWSGGRWFLPVTGAGLDFTVNDRIKIGIDLRSWLPVYRLWTGEKLPALEGWRFSPGIRFTIRPGSE